MGMWLLLAFLAVYLITSLCHLWAQHRTHRHLIDNQAKIQRDQNMILSQVLAVRVFKETGARDIAMGLLQHSNNFDLRANLPNQPAPVAPEPAEPIDILGPHESPSLQFGDDDSAPLPGQE
jgi:hypothetical protein